LEGQLLWELLISVFGEEEFRALGGEEGHVLVPLVD
jgi:hypothetical protein